MSDKSDEEGPRLKDALKTIMNYDGNNEEDLRIANAVRGAMVNFDFSGEENDRSADDVDGAISYFDRVVFEAGGTAGDVNIDNNASGEVGDGDGAADNGMDAADDGSVWSMIEDDEEESDDEMDFDSDEESIRLQRVIKNGTSNSAAEHNLSEESKELLLWRLDKDESFSDWTIEVSVANNNGENNDVVKTIYHVHKSTLGLGPKKSGYFEALLKSGQFSESSTNTSAVELPSDVAVVFPDFLDYMYAQPLECKCIIKRENRRALQYLAKYFLVPKLTIAIHGFIEQDIQNLDQIEGYVTEFGGTEDDESRKVLAYAANVCAHKILHIGRDSSLLTTLTPAMVLHMIRTVSRSKDILTLPDAKREHVCELAIEYTKHHHACLDANYFRTLTSELYFPDDTNLARKVAIKLLEIMELAKWEKETISQETLESIKGFCTAILSRNLTAAIGLSPTPATYDECVEKVISDLKRVPKSVVLRLLANAQKARNVVLSKKSKKKFSVSCKLTSEYDGWPVGSTVKVDVYPTDSIGDLYYLISHQLKINQDVYMKCEGKCILDLHTLVCNTPISANTVLEISQHTL